MLKKHQIKILCRQHNKSGTGVVINYLLESFKCELISRVKIRTVIKDDSLYICIQPTAVIVGLVNVIKKKSRCLLIFDSHPLSLGSPIRIVCYWLTAFFAYLLCKSSICFVPNGPLARLFPFNKFVVCNWFPIVKPKFKFLNPNHLNGFLYYGTYSNAKSANIFSNIDTYPVPKFFKGFCENLSPPTDIKHVTIQEIEGYRPILVVTSKIESYGLAFREYIKSGGFVIFMRRAQLDDRVKNAVYVFGKQPPDFKILKTIDEHFDQSNYEACSYPSLFDQIYIKAFSDCAIL